MLKINKLLVVCLDNLGDSVMATACLKPLTHIFPAVKLGFWVKKYAAPLFLNHPALYKLHAADPFWDKSPGQPKGSFRLYMKTLSEIRTEKYEAALLLNTEWRRTVSCLWAKIPQRIGFARRHASPFLTHRVPATKQKKHFIEEHRQLISTWVGRPLTNEPFHPTLNLTKSEAELAKEWSSENDWPTSKYLVLHPFTGDERKCWPLNSWFELIEHLRASRIADRFLIIGGKSDEAALQPFQAQISSDSIRILMGAPLALTKGLLAKSMGLVGGDSGPGHIAAALKVPVLSLFGRNNTAAERSGPRGNGSLRTIQVNSLAELPASKVYKEVLALLL